VKTVQVAFDATMKDRAFITDAEKIGLEVEPLSGAEIEKVMAEINAASQEAIDRLGKLVN
jgi:hypothetical protein